MRAKECIGSLRLPFITSSIIPFVFGSFLVFNTIDWPKFIFGLLAVVFAHLGANLLNDYADSRSGCDWSDLKSYGFFGGSKLIQQGKLSEKFYFYSCILFFAASFICIVVVSLLAGGIKAIILGLAIIFLAWAYSAKPLRLSYIGLGEPAVFILFGQGLVMGGYFIQTGIFPDMLSFVCSLPLAFLIMAILLSNEVPDYPVDIIVHKKNWVVLLGPHKSYAVYLLIIAAAFISISAAVVFGFISEISLFALLPVIFGIKAARVLRLYYDNKLRLVESSRLTILMHNLTGIILIAAEIIR